MNYATKHALKIDPVMPVPAVNVDIFDNTADHAEKEVDRQIKRLLKNTVKKKKAVKPRLRTTELYVDGELCRFHLDGRIFYIDHEYRDSLQNIMDKDNDTEKDRPYLALWYDECTTVLVPFRSKCRPSWATAIILDNRPHQEALERKRGLDFSKMLIVSNDELADVLSFKATTTPDYVLAVHDKAEQMVDKVMSRFCDIKRRSQLGETLNEAETYLLKDSTLVNYDIY